jgi:predicted RNA binding protein YcfA (HicA-like mRNA interferase family)
MGTKKYPPLTPREVQKILRANGFTRTGSRGSHEQWEKGAQKVTVDTAIDDYGIDLMQSMIRQSGMTRNHFYCSTRETAKKINKRKLKQIEEDDEDITSLVD